jgi:hypothetical protein
MMDNFAQILRRLPTEEASSSSGHATPFKVHVNFDIPLFEGLIDAYVVDKWLNLLEGYFYSQLWVKGAPLHFIFDSDNQNKLISTEVIKRMDLPTTLHPQPYTIG